MQVYSTHELDIMIVVHQLAVLTLKFGARDTGLDIGEFLAM